MGLFDVHAHLTDDRLAAREDEILDNAMKAGVTTIISNGLNPIDNAKVLALAQRSEIVKPAIGLYPVDAVLLEMTQAGVEYPRTDPPVPSDDAIAWISDHLSECFAIGEIGLDHYWVPENLWQKQEEVFRRLVKMAMDADKAIIIHSRKAESRTFEILKEMGATRVNWHCFSSKVKLGRRIAAHGHYLSIPANVRKSDNFRQLLRTLPRDKVLLETDCPYLSPTRGSINEPANVAKTAAYAAELWETSLDAVQEQLSSNFEQLFGVQP